VGDAVLLRMRRVALRAAHPRKLVIRLMSGDAGDGGSGLVGGGGTAVDDHRDGIRSSGSANGQYSTRRTPAKAARQEEHVWRGVPPPARYRSPLMVMGDTVHSVLGSLGS
jgi:hypothetical protein